MTLRPNRPARASGFTILELVMVLVLIGVILAMVGPRVFQNLGRANSEVAKSQMATVGGQLELFKLDVGRFPTTQEGLAALVTAPSGASNWNGPYIKDPKSLKDPWGRDFVYKSPGDKGAYDLLTLGADGKEGGDGENRDVRN